MAYFEHSDTGRIPLRMSHRSRAERPERDFTSTTHLSLLSGSLVFCPAILHNGCEQIIRRSIMGRG
ncbi:MAG TPA: hypothetical protein VL020_00570, partial [Pseudomonadales bacterium]|nr:hypothetical protein [Pseudomonadales bacterium]